MKKLAMILVALLMVAVLFAGGKKENKTTATGEAKGYTYGEVLRWKTYCRNVRLCCKSSAGRFGQSENCGFCRE